MRVPLAVLIVLGLTAACAGEGERSPALEPATFDSPIPGTIGVAVDDRDSGVIVVGVRAGSAAAGADVREGDRISRCNGAPVTSARDFERRVLDARPGSVIEVEIIRGSEWRRVSLPVEEILTAVLA